MKKLTSDEKARYFYGGAFCPGDLLFFKEEDYDASLRSYLFGLGMPFDEPLMIIDIHFAGLVTLMMCTGEMISLRNSMCLDAWKI